MSPFLTESLYTESIRMSAILLARKESTRWGSLPWPRLLTSSMSTSISFMEESSRGSRGLISEM